MCGISGLLYFDKEHRVEESLLDSMSKVTRHRGPDDHRKLCRRNVGFAFNRLSIIDLAGGGQPMANEDETARIVFNGEIYNFVELRKKLIEAGHRFRTQSDTEIILHAWEEYGEECVNQLRGMFAFAIWDDKEKRLFAARDRIGIKPFYYYFDRERFAFASEIKSLLEIPEISREIDFRALPEYLRHGYVISPHTLFRHILKLRPAHVLTVRENRIETRRYWDVPLDSLASMTEQQALSEFEPLLDETVRLHLLSDVPLGVFLSGGLDSSSIVAVMSRLGIQNIKTFSVGYDSPESELAGARIVAKHHHTDHHEVRLTASKFRDLLPRVAWHLDEPVADAPSVALFYLSQLAASEISVVLSGEGADEVFGGYPMYRRMLRLEQINRLPFVRWLGDAFRRYTPAGKLRKNGAMLGQALESSYRASVIFPLEEIARLLPGQTNLADPYDSVAPVYERCRQSSLLARMSYVDLSTWMPDDLLLKADRMSMAHSLELRVPFLDHRLVEFATRLRQELKIRGAAGKYLLRRLVEPFLPPATTQGPKRGFPIPTRAWFRGELSDYVRDKLLSTDSACMAFFPRGEVVRLLEAHRYRDCSNQIHALLGLDEWCRAFH